MAALLLWIVAVGAGVLNTVQAGANVTLNKTLGQPIAAALVVMLANLATYLAASLFVGLGWPGSDRIAAVPWWGWLGGVMGGAYVLAVMFVAGRVGAAVFMGLTVTAAIVTSVAMDHFGWVGFDVHAAGLGRLGGSALMIVGLILVCLF